MTERIYCDRSRAQAYLRCKRQRYWEYESGPKGMGIVPVRKSIHLVIGLGFHAGVEVPLRMAMDAPNAAGSAAENDPRAVENKAVEAALAELSQHLASGVEVDLVEQPEQAAAAGGKKDDANTIQRDSVSSLSSDRTGDRSGDSPIVIDFNIDFNDLPAEVDRVDVYSTLTQNFSDPVYSITRDDEESRQLQEIEIHTEANLAAATGVDEYLKKELAALVEGMVRAYARRRLSPLLAEFEVLEVEREGSWKLGEIAGRNCDCWIYGWTANVSGEDHHPECQTVKDTQELWWMSRHDALLLERQTNSLYLLSYKTTGTWDRRKKADAEIDMQGLSEAVDVEKRLGEAWELLTHTIGATGWDRERMADRLVELVSLRTAQWLSTLPAPPRILGVRYEYILKGSRRQDKKDPLSPGRYVQDSPLVRAYRSDGITAEDRRWAPNYEWYDQAGKSRRIDYRSWRKSAVWETIPISQWIDMLDSGEYWPGKGEDYDEHGRETDILSDQFVPPVIVYRNEDDLRDMIEQTEAQEIKVALDVAEVRRAEQEGGEGAKRSALNRLFSQTRTACNWSFGGVCPYKPVCYGGEDIRRDPLNNSDKFKVREANHPIETNVAAE